MAKKIGTLIKEARTAAGLTQAQLAKKVDGVTAADISKAERGEKELSQAALKQIAKATGVTQSSLLNAAKGSGTASSSSSTSSMKLNSSEKKLVELYRKADSKTKSAAMKLLKGEKNEVEEVLGTLLGTVGDMVDMFSKKEKGE